MLIQRRAAERKQRVVLRHLRDEFRFLLVLTKLDDLFEIEPEALSILPASIPRCRRPPTLPPPWPRPGLPPIRNPNRRRPGHPVGPAGRVPSGGRAERLREIHHRSVGRRAVAAPSGHRAGVRRRPPTLEATRRLIGYLGHESQLYADLTPRSRTSSSRPGSTDCHVDQAVSAILDRLEVGAERHNPVRRLSRGYVQRVALCRSLIHRPKAVGVGRAADRPRSGQPRSGCRLVESVLADGVAVLLVSHDLGELWRLSGQVHRGRAGDDPVLDDQHRDPACRASTADCRGAPMTTFRGALVIAAKDLRVELASRAALTSAVTFAVMVSVIFNFARDPGEVSLQVLAPSVLWVTSAFAGVVTLNRSFTMEQERGAMEGLLLAPVGRSAIYFGKYLANLAFVLTVNAVLLPLFVLFFNVTIEPAALAWVAALLVLAAAGYVAIGTVLAAMTVRTRFAELMLPVLLLAFLVPPVLVGVQATTRLLGGRPAGEIIGWVRFLVIYDIVFITLGWLLFPATMDE